MAFDPVSAEVIRGATILKRTNPCDATILGRRARRAAGGAR
jgi:hypothetical protein